MSMLLAAVLAGSTDPAEQIMPQAAKKLKCQPALRARIEQSRTRTTNLFGETETIFTPEYERVKRVVVKNARGHALYELDRWMNELPNAIMITPIQCLTQEQRDNFEGITGKPLLSGWPEVGTRMFMRLGLSFNPDYHDLEGQWVVVQDGYYRYWVEDTGVGLLVKSIIYEYLAAEVYWSDDDAE